MGRGEGKAQDSADQLRSQSPVAALVGKTIEMIDVGESVTIRFTDGEYLELNGDYSYQLNGDRQNIVEAWFKGQQLHGRAE